MYSLALMLALPVLTAQDGTSLTVATSATNPHMTMDDEDGIYIVFVRGGAVEVAISHDRGKTFSRPVVVFRRGMGLIPSETHAQSGPRIAVDARKRIYVTTAGSKLILARSEDGGKSFEKRLRVSDGRCIFQWIAASPEGEIHVAWLSYVSGLSLTYARIADGAAKSSSKLDITDRPCPGCAPGVAVDDKGNPYVVWREFGNSDEIVVATSKEEEGPVHKIIRVNRAETKQGG